MMSQSDLSKMQYDGSAPTIATRQLPRSGFVQPQLCGAPHNVGNGNREAATIAVVTRSASLPRMSSAPRPPACHRSRARQGQALRVAAKSAAILDRHSTRWRSRTAVGAEEWLRRGQTKEWVWKQVSCQEFVVTIRKGRHQFSWHKKQEHLRIFPSDTVVVLRVGGTDQRREPLSTRTFRQTVSGRCLRGKLPHLPSAARSAAAPSHRGSAGGLRSLRRLLQGGAWLLSNCP